MTTATEVKAGDFLPGPVLLLGAPGVGKGTQSKILMEEYGIPQVSTGDLLRDNIARSTDLGSKAKALMNSGQLVPDEVVNGMVASRLASPDAAHGYILDGYPRTLGQSEWLDDYLAENQDALNSLDLVAVSLKVDESDLLRRITGRRSCSLCKHIYNIYSHPPKVEGVCDLDGAPLVQRGDDTETAFAERMKAYESQTAAVIAHYRERGRFAEVDGTRPVDEVTGAIREALYSLRKAG